MDEEEYAIVSKKEFLALKKELEKIKKNPLEGSDHGENLQASIDNLNKSLNVMLEVFKQAADDMKLEEHDSDMATKQIGPIAEKVDKLIDQNQKIAKGIVAVADLVKEKLEEISDKVENSGSKLPPLMGGPKPGMNRPPAPMGMPPGVRTMPSSTGVNSSGIPPLPSEPGLGMPSQNGMSGMEPPSSGLPPPGNMGIQPPGTAPLPISPSSPMPPPTMPGESTVPTSGMSGKKTIMGGLMK